MKSGIFLVMAIATLAPTLSFSEQKCPELLDHDMRKLGSSTQVNLCDAYAGKLLLVVNTASRCAFTPQYAGLEALYQELRGQGLVVLGFPSNDFAGQEPCGDKTIKDFCRINYGVQFPMFSKIQVTGEQAHPFYKQLAEAADSPPRWNFHKYLIGRDGQVIDAWSSLTSPDSKRLRRAIERAL